ncbi:hypothetical protein NBRC110019_16510 [Neptunitalea chrysea]|uniref:Uncharacterized protein n=1 Tax=Neptunitalea chrysea TaxID=1647581 RepID=A0A9W6EV81_9FLAO|nr:hypothetical protein [Neptunitalea chrysea]GLB52611.1 hypothetical protein NBRC110019_16510 [Neptunitalea chrysea]
MTRILFLLLIGFGFKALGQTTYKEKITLLTHEEKVYEVPGADGDAIHIELDRISGSKIDMEVTIYPRRPFFHEDNFKKLSRIITVTRRGVYIIKLSNPDNKEAMYDVRIVSNNYTGSPVTLDHKLVVDTTYAYKTEQLSTIKKLEATSVQNEKFYLNSRSNAYLKGGKNSVLVPVNLPENTKEWYYVFTASRDESEVKQTLNSFNFVSALSGYIKEDKDLQSAISSMASPPGAEICDIYMVDEKNAKLFNEDEDYTYNIDASRENYKSGVVTVKKTNKEKQYLVISNPDNLHGIHIAVEVVAVIETEAVITKKVSMPVITSQKIPVVKDLN